MRSPRVDPVGLSEIPPEYRVAPRSYSASDRLTAALILSAFLGVGIATTVYSLGVYCLTSHAGTPFSFTTSP